MHIRPDTEVPSILTLEGPDELVVGVQTCRKRDVVAAKHAGEAASASPILDDRPGPGVVKFDGGQTVIEIGGLAAPGVQGDCALVLDGIGADVHKQRYAIAENERLQARLRKQIQTSAGREALRERTTIEHKLAHISQRQGNEARYVGVRKNTFDIRRASAIQNLETLHLAEIQSQEAA